MKKISIVQKTVWILVILAITAGSGSPVQAGEGDSAELTGSTLKPVYSHGDNIVFGGGVKNTGPRLLPLIVRYSLWREGEGHREPVVYRPRPLYPWFGISPGASADLESFSVPTGNLKGRRWVARMDITDWGCWDPVMPAGCRIYDSEVVDVQVLNGR